MDHQMDPLEILKNKAVSGCKNSDSMTHLVISKVVGMDRVILMVKMIVLVILMVKMMDLVNMMVVIMNRVNQMM